MKHHSLANKIIATFILSLSFLLLTNTASAFTNLADGKQDDIKNHIGNDKWTVLEVWASDCHACREHMPSMVKFDGKLKNTRLLSISLDGQRGSKAAEDFVTEFDMKFPTILSNAIEMNVWMQQNLGESLIGTPTFIIFDPKGKLVAAQPGPVKTASLEKFITLNSPPEKEIFDAATDTSK